MPKTGKALLAIDGDDVPLLRKPQGTEPLNEELPIPMQNEIIQGSQRLRVFRGRRGIRGYRMAVENQGALGRIKKKKRPAKFLEAIDFGNGGKYIHFGIESALLGESPGLYFKDANIIQCAQIYKLSPDLLPKSVKDKVYCLINTSI